MAYGKSKVSKGKGPIKPAEYGTNGGGKAKGKSGKANPGYDGGKVVGKS